MELLVEASLKRFENHLKKDGDCIAIVSACRGEKSVAENNARTREQRKMISLKQAFMKSQGTSKNYGFHKAMGGYIETYADGSKKDITEHSTCIYAHCETEQEEKTFRVFVEFLGYHFEQESVLFVRRDKKVYWIYTSGDLKGTVEEKGEYHDHAIENYYTRIHKKVFAFEKHPKNIKDVKLKPFQCESVSVSDWGWFSYTPSERRGMDKMFEVLDEVVGNGSYDYERVGKYSYSFKSLRNVIENVLLEK